MEYQHLGVSLVGSDHSVLCTDTGDAVCEVTDTDTVIIQEVPFMSASQSTPSSFHSSFLSAYLNLVKPDL